MSNATCENDFDCPGTLRCVTLPVDWKSEINFCSCFYFFGYKGEKCDEKGPQTYYSIVTTSIQIIVIGFLILRCFGDFVFILVNKNQLKFTKAVHLTWFYTIVGFVLFLVWRALILMHALKPDLHNHRIEDEAFGNPNEKTQKYNLEARLLQSAIYGLAVCAAMSISIMWWEIAYRSKRLIKVGNSNTLIENYHRVNYGMQVLYIVILASTMITGQGFAALLSVPFVFVIFVTYAIGHMRISKVLKDMIANTPGQLRVSSSSEDKYTERDNEFSKLLRSINHTARGIMILLCLVVVCLLALTIIPNIDGRPEQAPPTRPGEISLYFVVNDCLYYSVLFIFILVNNYVRKSWTATPKTSSKLSKEFTSTKKMTKEISNESVFNGAATTEHSI